MFFFCTQKNDLESFPATKTNCPWSPVTRRGGGCFTPALEEHHPSRHVNTDKRIEKAVQPQFALFPHKVKSTCGCNLCYYHCFCCLVINTKPCPRKGILNLNKCCQAKIGGGGRIRKSIFGPLNHSVNLCTIL